MTFYPGKQVVKYDPYNHESPHEAGFVTSVNYKKEIAYVRYWKEIGVELRTKANSEGTPFTHLYPQVTCTKDAVSKQLRIIENG